MTMAKELAVPSELKFLVTRVSPEQLERLVRIALTEGLWTVAAEVYNLGKQMQQRGKVTLEDKKASVEAQVEATVLIKDGALMVTEARHYRRQHPVNDFVRVRLR